MKIIEPGMDESNVTIDMVAKKSREFAERLNHIALTERTMKSVARNMRAYFSERDEVEYGSPEIMAIKPPTIEMRRTSSTSCSIMIGEEGALKEFSLIYNPRKGYQMYFDERLEEGCKIDLWSKALNIGGFIWTNMDCSKDGKIMRYALRNDKDTNVILAKYLRAEEERGIQVIKTPPYDSLKHLDHLANEILGLE